MREIMNHLTLFYSFALHILLLVYVSSHDNTFPPCELGFYRSNSGLRECTQCPRGRYGSSTDLISAACTAPCPAGRYNDLLGAKSVADCQLCPAGTYGAAVGQMSSVCTAYCPRGKYSTLEGQISELACQNCPPGYYQSQCANRGDFDIPPRGEQEF